MAVCQHESCTSKIAIIIGYCKYCNKNFCGAHRLPETHGPCVHLDKCKQMSFDSNKEKLLKNATYHSHNFAK